MDLRTAFTLPDIRRLHTTRATRILDLLTNGVDAPRHASWTSGDPATIYSFAHHLLEGAEHAARAHDADTFAWYTTAPTRPRSDLSPATAASPRIVVAPPVQELTVTAISETPCYLIGPSTTPAAPEVIGLVTDALTLAADTGFAPLLDRHAIVICLLREKPLGATLDSWSISRLPGTVFTDHTGEAAVLARDLIHEAGHNFLNDALTATDTTLPGDATFFSPWKDTQRPAFGFLHACWSFPLTMLHTARILPHTTGPTHRYLTDYLHRQHDLLATTTDDHPRAVALVADPALRDLLADTYQSALAL